MNKITEEMKSDILNRIGEKRYNHTIRVRDTAVELAKIYNVDLEKAYVAGMLHDCAKIRDEKELIEVSFDYGLSLTDDMKKAPQIIHSFLGAIISEKKYGIEDEDVLNAIRFHTTGRENMSDLEKIVFLADYIEPMRNFSGVDKARELSYEDLNKAMMYSLNNTILFLCNKDEYIALDTIKARNYILEIENEKIF